MFGTFGESFPKSFGQPRFLPRYQGACPFITSWSKTGEGPGWYGKRCSPERKESFILERYFETTNYLCFFSFQQDYHQQTQIGMEFFIYFRFLCKFGVSCDKELPYFATAEKLRSIVTKLSTAKVADCIQWKQVQRRVSAKLWSQNYPGAEHSRLIKPAEFPDRVGQFAI